MTAYVFVDIEATDPQGYKEYVKASARASRHKYARTNTVLVEGALP